MTWIFILIQLLGWGFFIAICVLLARQSSPSYANCWIGLHKWLFIDKRYGGKWCPLCGKVKYGKKDRITEEK